MNIDIMVHLSMTNMTKKDLRYFLDSCKNIGIKNILAIRGDPPRGYDSWIAVDEELKYCADLVRFIRKEYGDYFSIFVGGYPEGHHNCEDLNVDILHLKDKVNAGADAIITQLFYDTKIFFNFVEKCRQNGINVPIIPGLMPMQTFATFVRIVSFTNISVPAHVWKELEPIKHNDSKVKEYGINYMVNMCKQILDSGINTLHFYTFNLERSVTQITQKLNFYYSTKNIADQALNPNIMRTKSCPNFDNFKSEFPWDSTKGGYLRNTQESVRPIFWANRQESYLHRTAHWDEFPNGRWGDSRSPAYGDFLDHHLFRQTKLTLEYRLKMWKTELNSFNDIFNVFIAYLDGKIDQLPWCNQQIGQETLTFLLEPLKLLNSFGFLTINSQPQVNGAPSSDPVVGWGNSNGFVYQKAYLEFFCSKANTEKLLNIIGEHTTLSYQAINCNGKLKTNVERLTNVNAVTWGVFPNEEILQPTIVDPQSFIAWKDEAFSLWTTMWQSIYKKESKSYELIEQIKEEWFLVNIVENNYINGQIFEPFIKLLKNEKDFKHFVNIFKSAKKSQQKMWCNSSNSESISPKLTYCVKTGNDENESKLNLNFDKSENGNPYLDQALIKSTNDSCSNQENKVEEPINKSYCPAI